MFNEIETYRLNNDCIFYHDTSAETVEVIKKFKSFRPNLYSNWDAVWITDMWDIAEQFTRWYSEDLPRAIAEVSICREMRLADLRDYDFANELKDYYGTEDLRDLIPYLEGEGFDGWIATGSIGVQYDDICIFDYYELEIKNWEIL